MNFTQLTLAQDVKAVVIAEQYYLESYNYVYFREFVFEFPEFDITNYKLNIEVARITDKNLVANFDQKVKKIFTVEMAVMCLLFIMSVIRVISAKYNGEKVFFMVIIEIQYILFAVLGHLFYFEFYSAKDFHIDDMSYVKLQRYYEKQGMSFYIILFVLQAFRTQGSGYQNFDITTILWVTNYIVYWIAPLLFLYALVICMLTFLAEPITFTFTKSFLENAINVFRIVCQTNIELITKMLNESPGWFILIITVFEILIFYFINNIYFGLQFENVRLLTDSRTNNYNQKMPSGEVRNVTKRDQTLGFWTIITSSCFSKYKEITKEKNSKDNEGVILENKDAEEILINPKKR